MMEDKALGVEELLVAALGRDFVYHHLVCVCDLACVPCHVLKQKTLKGNIKKSVIQVPRPFQVKQILSKYY